jgi:hypothetical protein
MRPSITQCLATLILHLGTATNGTTSEDLPQPMNQPMNLDPFSNPDTASWNGDTTNPLLSDGTASEDLLQPVNFDPLKLGLPAWNGIPMSGVPSSKPVPLEGFNFSIPDDTFLEHLNSSMSGAPLSNATSSEIFSFSTFGMPSSSATSLGTSRVLSIPISSETSNFLFPTGASSAKIGKLPKKATYH